MPGLTQQQKRAYSALRQRLLTGALDARQPLSQRKLATELGVSSACVQMVLGRLETDGLIVRYPQTGTCLRSIDYREYCQNFDMRVLIEPYAAGQAAGFISARQLRLLDTACRKFEQVLRACGRSAQREVTGSLRRRIVQAEYLFHGTIMQACGNPTAAHVIENLQILQNVLFLSERLSGSVYTEELPKAAGEHRGILEALAAADAPAAEARMRAHLRNDRLYQHRTPPEP